MGSVLAPFWDPFGLQDRSKIGPKIIQKLSCSNIPPQDRPERPQDLPKTPQEVSRSPHEAPKSLPRGSKRDPRPPETPPSDPRNSPRWSHEIIISLRKDLFHFPPVALSFLGLHLQNNSRKLPRSHQEAPRSFQKSNGIALELPSLQASECLLPSGLGGIREAQTI